MSVFFVRLSRQLRISLSHPTSIHPLVTPRPRSTVRLFSPSRSRPYSRSSTPAFIGQAPAGGRAQWQARFQRARQTAQQKRYRQAFNYQQYQAAQSLLKRWVANRYFYWQVGGIAVAGGTYYTLHLEEVPVSHRTRFRNISYQTEAALGQQMLQETLGQYGGALLPPNHPLTQKVQRVARRLIPHSGLEGEKWQVFVINSPETNAFVIPGGSIFVFKGMLDICKTDDSLAAVIGHEIGHNVAHHAAERASSQTILRIASLVLYAFTGVDFGLQDVLLNFVFALPGSRAQESEADYIGLLMMSEACYEPRAAMEMWATMEAKEKTGIPQWLSTHPSNHNRMEKIREWLPQADEKVSASGCRSTRSYLNDFESQALAFRR